MKGEIAFILHRNGMVTLHPNLRRIGRRGPPGPPDGLFAIEHLPETGYQVPKDVQGGSCRKALIVDFSAPMGVYDEMRSCEGT